jgi:hypothetical protein
MSNTVKDPRVNIEKLSKVPPLPISDDEEEKDPFDYHHRVETCPCGYCALARYHRDTWKKAKKN